MLKKTWMLLPFFALILLTHCKKSGGATSTPTPPVTPVDTTHPPVAVVDTPVLTPIIPPTNYTGYSLLWNDEFNGTSIDNTKWKFETGTGVNGDFGTGQLDRATDRPENATIANGIVNSGGGCLAITTRRENYMDRSYTSARLTTEGLGAWGPGTRIEARVWAKGVQYKGQGFAFWMMPAEKPANQSYIMWPQGGEVDVMEYVGSIPAYNLATVHYAWFWQNNQYADWNHGHQGAYYSFADRQVPSSNPSQGGWPIAAGSEAGSAGFHVYRADWYSNRMEFSIDDQVYHIHYFKDGDAFGNAADGQDANGTVIINGKRVYKSEYSSNHFAEWSPFEHNFFLLLTAGVGGSDQVTYGGAIVPQAVFPCTTYIDWVRVYKRL